MERDEKGASDVNTTLNSFLASCVDDVHLEIIFRILGNFVKKTVKKPFASNEIYLQYIGK